jgi:hypothetical protein
MRARRKDLQIDNDIDTRTAIGRLGGVVSITWVRLACWWTAGGLSGPSHSGARRKGHGGVQKRRPVASGSKLVHKLSLRSRDAGWREIQR